MANKNAATHSGHCQWCGRLQKLPKGVLSIHGYTVEHGFFAGVCRGTGYKPFEESTDLIEKSILEAEAERDRIQAWQAELVQPATENLAWVHNYEMTGYGRYSRTAYTWRQVEVLAEEHTSSYDGGKWLSFSYMAPGTGYDRSKLTSHRIEGYSVDHAKTVLDCVTALNKTRARALDRNVRELVEYVRWQRERVANWKPMPLLPVTHKDKEGFKVE